MFKNLTYKQKNTALLVAGVLLIWLAYSFSFKNTIELKQDCNALETKIALATNAPEKIKALEIQLQQVENTMGSNSSKPDNTQQTMLGFVSDYCKQHNAILRAFPQATTYNEKEVSIQTHYFTVESNFITLLKLIYELEQKNKIAEVASVHFQSKKEVSTKRTTLTATIYTQQIKKQTHDE